MDSKIHRQIRTHRNRLDRIYIAPTLTQQLENCQIHNFPPELLDISDHKPVSAIIKGSPGGLRNQNTRRMNAALFHDTQSQEEIEKEIQRTLQEQNQHHTKE